MENIYDSLQMSRNVPSMGVGLKEEKKQMAII